MQVDREEERETPTCVSCRFRSDMPYINPDRGTAEFPGIMFACKRHSPVVTGGMHCPTMTIWPTVTNDDWCGDWQVIEHLSRTKEPSRG